MGDRRVAGWSRRDFLNGLVLAGGAALAGWRPGISVAGAEPPPETTRLRLLKFRTDCWAPQYVAEELLRAEGFTDIEYVRGGHPRTFKEMLASGQIDLRLGNAGFQMVDVEADDRAVFLAGLHTGCYSVIGGRGVSGIRDLKGKNIWAGGFLGSGPHIFFSIIAAYVGLDPIKDFNFITGSAKEALQLFAEGKLGGFISFSPGPQKLRAKAVGRVLLDTNVDKPWSQYFCCMVAGNREFTRKNPVATRRALRAILKGNDIVAGEPERAARTLIEKNVRTEDEYEFLVQSMTEIPYAKWRDYNPEDTIRFYALRLKEVGMIKTSPEEIIKRHADWSHLESLRQELALKW